MHIPLPPNINIRSARAIIEYCDKASLSTDHSIIFDLSKTSFLDPFGVTILAGKMLDCIDKGFVVKYIKPAQFKMTDKYLSDIGFYEFGHGQRSVRSETQVELKMFKALDPTYSQRLMDVLNYKIHMSQLVQEYLMTSLNELMTNAFDHSESKNGCFICAQTYQKKSDKINICITDFGIGILDSLKKVNDYAALNNSVEAITLAIKEGITSRVNKRGGLGFSFIHNFLKANHGEIHMISEDGWVCWNYESSPEKISIKPLNYPFRGTIINIIAKVDSQSLYRLRSERSEEDFF